MINSRNQQIASQILLTVYLVIHTASLILIVRSMFADGQQESKQFFSWYFLHLMAIVVAIAWMALITRIIRTIKLTLDDRKTSTGLALLSVFLSLGLIGLKMLPDFFAVIYFILTVVAVSIVCRIRDAVIINCIAGIIYAVLLFFIQGVYAAKIVAVLTAAATFLTIYIGSSLLEWEKQTRLFDQARWAASQFAHANVRLQDFVSITEIESRIKERTRVGREIHDSVGYALTAILVQIRALHAASRSDPARLTAMLEEFEDLISETIQEVRAEVERLRAYETIEGGWHSRWTQLCKIFADFAGIRIHNDIDNSLDCIDSNIGSNIYRIIQEALTNAYRHGRATYVDIGLRMIESEGTIALRISDNGIGTDDLTLGSGLKGMRERVESVRGQIAFDTLPGKGFDVGIIIPYEKKCV